MGHLLKQSVTTVGDRVLAHVKRGTREISAHGVLKHETAHQNSESKRRNECLQNSGL